MRKLLVLSYGLVSYAAFLACFLYAAGFLGNILVPKSIDTPRTVPVLQAILVNTALLALFAVQHSVMARPAFKRWWTRYVPEPVERSTYVLLSSLCLFLLFWLWQPMGGRVWHVADPVASAVLQTVFATGWLIILLTSFLIDHFDLFGLRQTWLYFRGRAYTHPAFATPGPYRLVRHPLYVGWLLAFWATPTMTAAHAFFAIMTTAYILIAIQFEERDLARAFPEYQAYREQVPMFVPNPARAWPAPTPATTTTAPTPAVTEPA
jgi:protein-S-isoprenylcysteine O-methyltransferase Ste14